MAKGVQEFNFFYWFFRPLVQFGAVCHYRTFTVKGKENLPKEGGYILAPCHQQALMEPLAVLNITKKSPVFLARADIFKKDFIRKCLLFLKIMPVYRIRDGKESLSKNAEIFEKSRAVVLDGFPFCMMAEGRHNDKHQLLPLVKGMFRIAGETQLRMGDKPLYIVPTGIDFDEYERPFANLCVNIGKPINVQQFMETYKENEPVALNQMRDTVAEALSGQMFDIKSKENYKIIHTLTIILNREQLRRDGKIATPFNRFEARQKIAARFDQMEQENPPAFDMVRDDVMLYMKLLHRLHLSPKQESGHWKWHQYAIELALAVAVVTAAIVYKPLLWSVLFCLACYPIILLPTHLIFKRVIKDTQFRSSINFGARFFFSVIYTLVFSIIMGCTAGGWWGTLLPGINGFWWFLAAFNIPFAMAYCSGYLVKWFRHVLLNTYYWRKRIWNSAATLELRNIRKDLEARL